MPTRKWATEVKPSMEYMVARATVRRSAGGGDGAAAASSAAAIPGLGGNTATVCARTRCCTAAGQKNAKRHKKARTMNQYCAVLGTVEHYCDREYV